MALTAIIWQASWVLGTIILAGALLTPLIINQLHPFRILILKNTGGGRDSKSIVTEKKFRKARIINTDFGPRVKILWKSRTHSLSILSSDNAVQIKGGRELYIVYEKEHGQYFPANPNAIVGLDLIIDKAKKNSEKIKKLFETIQEKYPELAGHVRMVGAKSTIAPVTFANEKVVLQPVPNDVITGYAYDTKIRMQRIIRTSKLQAYMPLILLFVSAVIIITVMVMSYDHLETQAATYSGQIKEATNSFVDTLQKTIGGEEAPPGGGVFIPIIPFLFKRKGVAT